jgi:RNA polymerase sigma factor (sigma-70 family)
LTLNANILVSTPLAPPDADAARKAAARAQDDALDATWLARARSGDLHALGQLVRRHQARVRRQLTRLAQGDVHRADDLAQQTFVQAWCGLAAFRDEARVSTWLHRIAYNCFLQDLRERPAVTSLDTPHGYAPADASDDAAHGSLIASTDPRRADALRIDVARALAELPQAERVALLHCYPLDLTHEEAAAVLSVPLGTLKSQIARGKALLRDELAVWRVSEET